MVKDERGTDKMDEQKNIEAAKTEAKPKSNDDGDDLQKLSPIDRTNIAAERAEKATQELRAENDRREKLFSEEKLAGVGGSMQRAPEQTEQEQKKKGAAEFFKGTQIEKMIEKHG